MAAEIFTWMSLKYLWYSGSKYQDIWPTQNCCMFLSLINPQSKGIDFKRCNRKCNVAAHPILIVAEAVIYVFTCVFIFYKYIEISVQECTGGLLEGGNVFSNIQNGKCLQVRSPAIITDCKSMNIKQMIQKACGGKTAMKLQPCLWFFY